MTTWTSHKRYESTGHFANGKHSRTETLRKYKNKIFSLQGWRDCLCHIKKYTPTVLALSVTVICSKSFHLLGFYWWHVGNLGDRLIKCCLSRTKRLICINLVGVKFNGAQFSHLKNGKHDSLSNGKYNLLFDHIRLFPLFFFLHHALNRQNILFSFWIQIMKSNYPGCCNRINYFGWDTCIKSQKQNSTYSISKI